MCTYARTDPSVDPDFRWKVLECGTKVIGIKRLDIRPKDRSIPPTKDMSDTFREIVETNFQFLESRHNYRVVERSPASLAYESAKCILTMFYDHKRSYEVFCGLGLKSYADNPLYTFDEMMASQEVPTEEWTTGYAALNRVELERRVSQMARILENYLTPLLEGNATAWERLFKYRETACISYAESNDISRVKNAASLAWEKRNYKKVVELLGAYRNKLEGSDLAKLNYAEKRI